MNFPKLAIQLYSLREQAKADFPQVLRSVAKMGFQGVEFAGLNGMSAKDVRKVLDEAGLDACGAHVPAFDLTKAQAIIDDAKTLGYTRIGAGFGPDRFQPGAKFEEMIGVINPAIERFEAAGLTVYYHNHWWEFDNPGLYDQLMERCPKLAVQLDIYWSTVAGADSVGLIKKYASRLPCIHVKDGPGIKGQAMTAVGRGVVKTGECLDAAAKAGAGWYIVELDKCDTDMVQAVKDSAAFLADYQKKAGKK